jgi:HEAT repeat protein
MQLCWVLLLAVPVAANEEACIAAMHGVESGITLCIQYQVSRLDDREVATGAVEALKDFAPQSIPYLRAALKNARTGLGRANAADALGRIGPVPDEISQAVSGLTAALKDEDELVRRQAAAALGRLRWRSRPAVSALELCLEDDNEAVRHAAQFALSTIQSSRKGPKD